MLTYKHHMALGALAITLIAPQASSAWATSYSSSDSYYDSAAPAVSISPSTGQYNPSPAGTPVMIQAITSSADTSRPRMIIFSGNASFGTGRTMTAYFEWGQSSGYMPSKTTPQSISIGGSIYHTAIRMTPNTLYYYRFVMEDAYGRKFYGETRSVTTPSWETSPSMTHAPKARTDDPQKLDYTWRVKGYATLYGSANVQAYFEYSRNNTDFESTYPVSLNNDGPFQFTFARMDWSKPLYVRAVVKDQSGRIHKGSIVTIPGESASQYSKYAKPGAPVTGLPIQESQTSWTMTGTTYWADDYSNPRAYFEWGPTNSLGNQTGSVPTSHTLVTYYPLSNLQPNQTYYYRLVYQDNNRIERGAIQSFTTCDYGTIYNYTTGKLENGCKR